MQRKTFLSIFGCTETKPLANWAKKVRNGHIKRVKDDDVHAQVLEITGTNINTTFIRCPAKATLDVQLPCLVLIMKNLDRHSTLEVQILDDQRVRRRFRATTLETNVQATPLLCILPLRLDEGWNHVKLDLSDITQRVYATTFVECLRVQVQANCRLRQVYFTDRMNVEDGDSLPPENSSVIRQTPKPGPNEPEHKAPSLKGSFQRMHSDESESYVSH